MPEKRYAIVGIDPGSTFGIALLGLDGRGLFLHSTPNGFSDAARAIEQHCTPSLVACDTNPAPEAAQRLASYFSCRLFVPRQSVREDEKKKMAKSIGVENAHERDAYSAAVLAYRAHQNKLRQIEAIEGLPREGKERVKHLLLRGVRVQDAFLMLREPDAAKGAPMKAAAAAKSASPDELRARLESLSRENANLRLALERLERDKASLSHRLRLLENGVRESVVRDSEFRKLRFQLQQAVAKLGRGLPASEPRGSDPTNRLKWHRKPGQKAQEKPGKGKEPINKGEPQLDLERLVAEYRKGRK